MKHIFAIVAILLPLGNLPPLTVAAEDPSGTGLSWHEIPAESIGGRGWASGEIASYGGRLPAKAEAIVRPPVWRLGLHSAGLTVRFNTDAEEIHLRYTLASSKLAMPHMPATGVSGFDLYALDEGVWKWAAVFRPADGEDASRQEGKLIDRLAPVRRTYQLYFPLYNAAESLAVGLPDGASFELVAPDTTRPVVFYGTSITHGACASRPGMTHAAILGRRLDRPVVNLGFSGNGKMDLEVGALLAEIDAAAYVIDCLPNMDAEQVAERATPFIKALAGARPETPILLVEDRSFANAWIRPGQRDHHEASRAALIRSFDGLVSTGVRNLFYLEGNDLLGDDHEGTTDGSHPNDLGFLRQASVFEPILLQALASDTD